MAKINEYLRIGVRSLLHRKTKSLLTMIGIFIGIAAIVSLVSLGDGLENALEDQFARMGTRTLMIAPKGLTGPPLGAQGLTQDDADALESISDFDYVGSLLWLSAEIEFNKEEKILSVRGITPDLAERFYQDTDMVMKEGRPFEGRERFVANIGSNLAKDFFDKEIRLRNKINLNGYSFDVIGIFEEQGDQESDNAIFVPMDAARIIFDKEDTQEVSAIRAVVKPGFDLDKTKDKAIKVLEKKRGEEDFDVITPAQIAEQVQVITGVVSIFLVGIAAISLLVGAIGITNSMYTSVLERTREIGIMKAIGAANKDIMLMFLIESGMMGLIGGLIGVIVGVGISYGIIMAAKSAGFALLLFKLNIPLIIFGLLFAFVVGMLAGTLPAIRASKLKPVDALRYE